jgi:hypothetical protein
VTVIQNNDFIAGGGASTPADVIITAGGATLAPGADQLTYVAGGAAASFGQVSLESGVVAFQGSDAVLAYNRLFSIEDGAFSLSGSSLTGQTFERTLQVDSGGFALDGVPQAQRLSRAVGADAGQIAFSGFPVDLRSQKLVDLSQASYTFLGNDVQLRKSSKASPQGGTFLLSGKELGFISDKSIRPVSGVFSLSGQPLESNRIAELGGESGTYLLTGSNADFAQQQRFVELDRGVFNLSGGTLLFFITKQVVFGRYRPSSRRFLPGSHSFSSSRTINGREVRRLWCNRESNASLELEYLNIGEPVALEMLNLYNKNYGNYASIALPSSIFSGADASIEQYMNLSGTGMRWYFAEPPKIRGVKPGICSISLRFEGKISTERAL